MKRKINVPRTFKSIRHLPLEVPFRQVEEWVNQHHLDAPTHRLWLPYFLAKWWKKWSEN